MNVPAKYDFIELISHFPIIYPRVKEKNFFYFKLLATSCVWSVVLSKNNQFNIFAAPTNPRAAQIYKMLKEPAASFCDPPV